MGIQPTNIPQIDFRNPTAIMSQPGMPGGSNYSPQSVANARNRARFGQGSNPNAADYNRFLDPNNAENWRGTGQPGTRGHWQGAPGAQSGNGFNSAAYAGAGRWALGGQGSYGNSVQMDRNSNYPDTTSRIRNSNSNSNGFSTPTPMQRPNPLYNMPQTQTRPNLNSGIDPAFFGVNRPQKPRVATRPMYNQQYADGSYVPGTERPRPY